MARMMTEKMPSHVMRFYRNVGWAVDVLREQQVKLVRVDLFNDPFDPVLEPHYDITYESFQGYVMADSHDGYGFDKPDVLSYIQRTLPQMMQTSRDLALRTSKITYILSFVAATKESHPETLLMWAHYANGHKGVALKFCTDCIEGVSGIFSVSYDAMPPSIGVEDLDAYIRGNTTWCDQKMDKLMSCKSPDWCYEKEWRLMSREKDGKRRTINRTIASNAVEAIYLGCRIPEDNKQQICAAVEKFSPHTTIYQAKPAPGKFALIFEEIGV